MGVFLQQYGAFLFGCICGAGFMFHGMRALHKVKSYTLTITEEDITISPKENKS